MKKISIKTFYLLGIISIGLIGLAIGSTYAMFTTSAEISDPITISSNLTSSDDVMETFEVEIEPYKTVNQTININSGTVSNVNYGIWYINDITDVDVGILSTNSKTTGTIDDAGSSVTSNIVLRNYSSEKKTITLGIASSKNSIVLASNMKLVPQTVLGERKINTNAATYITKLYSTTEKSTVSNNSITYNTSPSQLLINDRKGSSSTGIDAGNIRYYGASPDNYVYFNCSDYSNPSSSTCELWRIIGVFDGKVKIMRNESIGAYSWDTTASTMNSGRGNNDWTTSKLVMLLNDGYTYLINNLKSPASLYWNRTRGTCYNDASLGTTNCDFTSTGLKNNTTKNMISAVTYYLGGSDTSHIYVNQMYEKERGNEVYTPGTVTSFHSKVAIPYPSDYCYATDLNACTETIANYSKNGCISNNWMYNIMTKSGTSDSWLLTPGSYAITNVWYLNKSGAVGYKDYAYSATEVWPVLHLSSDINIISGEGTKDSPYKIIPTLSTHIISLYDTSSKKQVTNNGITYQYDTTNNLMTDVTGSIRYYGASPKNYIYFNCSDYTNQSSSTCELWRIIGVFAGKVKLIRNETIGYYSWDTSDSNINDGAGFNDWTGAKIMKLLNPGYESESVGGSLYYNAKSGNCYSGKNNATKICDFTSTGIKNDTTRGLISDTLYYLGGYSSSSVYPNEMYGYERGTTVYTGRPTEWTGKIALAYPSDYGYAADLEKCNQTLQYYDDSTCISNNWMRLNTEGWTSLLTSNSVRPSYEWSIMTSGAPTPVTDVVDANDEFPVLFLNSYQTIKSGDGSKNSPYQLSVN